ncbi:MAG: glycosyltransferase family 4 protein [Candidatus Sericytochromatia bacterium]|nr:glycosyltransferase family 4 protein [Candidatus Sericytochromatia bacterium]
MEVLLVGPDRARPQVCGDDIVTRLLLAHPPAGVRYTHHAAALEQGRICRAHWGRAWLASLVMHSRPPAGVPYAWGPLPPLPYRLLGKLLPDRPDEDIQWLGLRPGHGFDLVHAWDYPVQLGPARGRPPVVLHVGTGNTDLIANYYHLPPDLHARLARRDTWLLRRLGVLHDLYSTREAAAVVVPSRYAWALHRAAGVPEAKLRVIRIGLDAPADEVLGAGRDPCVCRFTLVGHQLWRKGGRALLEAFDRVRRSHPEARLTLVSAVAPEDLGIDPAGVTIHPQLSREAIYRDIYPATDVFVLPSRAEGYGMAAVEAMGFGLPVIATRISALQELVEDEVTGLLVPPDDPAQLAAAMARLLEDATLRARLGAAGRNAFLTQHEIGACQAALRGVYDEALA